MLFKLVWNSELVWHNNLSLRTLWPLAIVPRPLIITHQTWLGPDAGAGRCRGALKHLVCARGRNVFISQALADASPLTGLVIPNPYDDTMFRLLPSVPRDRDVAFVGRLVSDKGVDILIEALAILANKNMRISATVIGEGPHTPTLKVRAAAAGLGDCVIFPGPMRGHTLTRELNRHRVLVVPSRWKEPFGIVALEGIACGCVVVGTSGGGLPEAIGPCGATVPNDDPLSLADSLASVLTSPDAMATYRERAPAHLAKFGSTAIIDAYETIISRAVTSKPYPE